MNKAKLYIMQGRAQAYLRSDYDVLGYFDHDCKILKQNHSGLRWLFENERRFTPNFMPKGGGYNGYQP